VNDTSAILIDSVSYNPDSSISFTGTRFSDALEDFADTVPAGVTVATDTSSNPYQVVLAGPIATGTPTGDNPGIFRGVVRASENVGLSGLISGGVDWRIWAGDTFANRSIAPFRVDDDGNAYMTNAYIEGIVSSSYVYGSSLMTKGTYLASSCAAADATINVGDTTDFPASGSASFIDSANDRDAFTYTGKTATTLTGCSGVLAHTVSATNKPLVVPEVKGVDISDVQNEMRFFGDRGDGTIEELLTAGIRGFDANAILSIGTDDCDYRGIHIRSHAGNGIWINVYHLTGIESTSVEGDGLAGISTSGNGVFGSSTDAEGVTGSSVNRYGVYGGSVNSSGVYGSSTNSYGVYSNGPAYINGNITVVGTARHSTAAKRRYYHLPLGSANPGSSGPTWVPADANTTGGWRLTNASWLVRGQADIHADWDGASDIKVGLQFMVNVNNTGGADTDTVDIKLVARYKKSGDTAVRTQTVENAVVVGKSAQYKQFSTEFTIDWDAAGNVISSGDAISININLETDTSEVDDIVITSMELYYNTTHIGIESGDV